MMLHNMAEKTKLITYIIIKFIIFTEIFRNKNAIEIIYERAQNGVDKNTFLEYSRNL